MTLLEQVLAVAQTGPPAWRRGLERHIATCTEGDNCPTVRAYAMGYDVPLEDL